MRTEAGGYSCEQRDPRPVGAHNARVRSDSQRIKNEIAKLNGQINTTRYVTFRASVNHVQSAYERLETAAESGRFDERYNAILDLAEREAANNVGLMNALLGETQTSEDVPAPNAPGSPLTPILREISADLGDSLAGALFALSPRNPDAARHFCTSAREIITQILDAKAPNEAVAQAIPHCERTQQGRPTRRAKLKYILGRRSKHTSAGLLSTSTCSVGCDGMTKPTLM